MPYYRFRIKGSTVRSILKSKKAYPAKSANQEDTAEKLSRVLRVDDEIYSQICFLETTANALQHYLCDEEFIKDESYEEDLSNMAMVIAREVSDIRQKLKAVVVL